MKDNRRTGRGLGANAADTVDPLISVTPARPRVCECPPPLALTAGRHFDELTPFTKEQNMQNGKK